MTNPYRIYIDIVSQLLEKDLWATQNEVYRNEIIFRYRTIFSSILIFLKYAEKDQLIACDSVSFIQNWYEQKLHSENYFSTIISETESPILESFTSSLDFDSFESCSFDIPIEYEKLLSVNPYELMDKDNITNTYQKSLGSYYTPSSVAASMIRKTISRYLSNNKERASISGLLSSCTFMDISCGGGVFLSECISYIKMEFPDIWKLNKNKIISNLYGNDVDPTTLNIALATILFENSLCEMYKDVKQNFRYGNMLVIDNKLKTDEEYIKVFSRGYVYHRTLGVPSSRFDEKYDIIIGNPPWEKIRMEDKYFFKSLGHGISNITKKKDRDVAIQDLQKMNVELFDFYCSYKDEILFAKRQIKKRMDLKLTGRGELNTYALFTELCTNLMSPQAVCSLIVKSGLFTSQVYSGYFDHVQSMKLLDEVSDFINKEKIFNIDSRERFAIIEFSRLSASYFLLAMNLINIDQFHNQERIAIRSTDLRTINPDSGMIPNITDKQDFKFLLNISNEANSFSELYSGVVFGRVVHFTSHSASIYQSKNTNNLPVYEGKFIHQFINKYAGFHDSDATEKYKGKARAKLLDRSLADQYDYVSLCRYFIDKELWDRISKKHNSDYVLAWRSLTSPTNRRTCIATILPFGPSSQSIQFLSNLDNYELAYLLGVFNSTTFDYILRLKLNGIDLTQKVINQMPMPLVSRIEMNIKVGEQFVTLKKRIVNLAATLICNQEGLTVFSEFSEHSVSKKSEQNISELNMLVMLAYNLTVGEAIKVMEEFSKEYHNVDREIETYKALLLNKAI